MDVIDTDSLIQLSDDVMDNIWFDTSVYSSSFWDTQWRFALNDSTSQRYSFTFVKCMCLKIVFSTVTVTFVHPESWWSPLRNKIQVSTCSSLKWRRIHSCIKTTISIRNDHIQSNKTQFFLKQMPNLIISNCFIPCTESNQFHPIASIFFQVQETSCVKVPSNNYET